MHIRIGSQWYEIIEVETGSILEADDYGAIHRDTLKLYLSKGMADSRKAEVILHEVVHGLLTGHLEDAIEEKVCLLLGEGLASFLGDNQDFVVRLMAQLGLKNGPTPIPPQV